MDGAADLALWQRRAVLQAPPAALLPPRAVVLSLSGVEASDFASSSLYYGLALFGAGIAVGWLLFGQKT